MQQCGGGRDLSHSTESHSSDLPRRIYASYLPPRRVVALLGVLLLAPAYSYAQQAAEDVLAQYASNLEERMDGIDDFTVKARLYIDTDQPVLRRMTVDIHVTQNGEQRTMKMETRMQDYRPVETMLFPYRRTVLMDYQLSEREKGQLRQRVQQFESAIEQAPEERRPKLRQQLAAMRAMMDGTTEIIFEAEDVRINTGVPDQYF